MRLLVANRGEIARRVFRTAHRLGHDTVAVYADPDESAPFVSEARTAVRLGPAALAESYLSIERILEAAVSSGADAIHPGYGFLSENATFARAVVEAGLVWVGPAPEAIEAMGSKIEARRLAHAAGVPIIPGFDESQEDDQLERAAAQIGFPVLVKAAAGGGGKGIRIAVTAADFASALNEARSEADRSFGDRAMIVERYVQRPRHVEVQVMGDKHGTVVHLGTRECSVQRRYQKVLEEAPAPNLPESVRAGLCDAAVQLAASIGYDSAGTVEFIVDDAALDGESSPFFFLEMNTRLQVEHPVTELITGLDLVELQLRVACGEVLPLAQDDVTFTGHAFEARINAEDATADFAPQIGTVTELVPPHAARWESGIEVGSAITPHYDPMVAKLVVAGPDRETARRRLAAALDQLVVGGLVTNTGFHRWLIDQAPVVAGRVTTRFLDETELPSDDGAAGAAKVAAAAWRAAGADTAAPDSWGALRNFRVTPHEPSSTLALEDLHGQIQEVELIGSDPAGRAGSAGGPAIVHPQERRVVVNVAGQSHTFRVLTRSERWAPADGLGHGHAGAIVAPFPAVVTEVAVSAGMQVSGGDAIVVIEAMKMLHTLAATGPGTVEEVRVAVGDQVASDQILVTFVPALQETEE